MNTPILLTWVTIASSTSPLIGRNTTACDTKRGESLYHHKVPVIISPPIHGTNLVLDWVESKSSSRLQRTQTNAINSGHSYDKTTPVTQIRLCQLLTSSIAHIFTITPRHPTLWSILMILTTYLPVQVPSTSVNSFFLTASNRLGPKYLGWSRISCSILI